MSTSVFTPAHITGFFSIEDNDDLIYKGSCGAGFLLNKGVRTTVKNSSSFDFKVNQGGNIIVCEVLKYFDTDFDFKITQDIQLPIGAGFGTSASSALSLTKSLNEFLDYGYSELECGQIAHKVELAIGGGLGDVIAQTGHGFVLRTKPGSPGAGEIQSYDMSYYVAYKNFESIDTSSVIGDDKFKRLISTYGRLYLKKLIDDVSIDNFLKLSYDFSKKTNLLTDEVKSAVNHLNSNEDIIGSSMAMLGNTVFSISDNKSAFKNTDLNILKII